MCYKLKSNIWAKGRLGCFWTHVLIMFPTQHSEHFDVYHERWKIERKHSYVPQECTRWSLRSSLCAVGQILRLELRRAAASSDPLDLYKCYSRLTKAQVLESQRDVSEGFKQRGMIKFSTQPLGTELSSWTMGTSTRRLCTHTFGGI